MLPAAEQDAMEASKHPPKGPLSDVDRAIHYAHKPMYLVAVHRSPGIAHGTLPRVPTFTHMHRRGMRSVGSFVGAGALLAVLIAGVCAITNLFLGVLTPSEFALAAFAIFVASLVGAPIVYAIAFRRPGAFTG